MLSSLIHSSSVFVDFAGFSAQMSMSPESFTTSIPKNAGTAFSCTGAQHSAEKQGEETSFFVSLGD